MVTMIASLFMFSSRVSSSHFSQCFVSSGRRRVSLHTQWLFFHDHLSRALLYLWQEEPPRPSWIHLYRRVSPKSGGESSKSGIAKGCSALDPFGRLCPALVSWWGGGGNRCRSNWRSWGRRRSSCSTRRCLALRHSGCSQNLSKGDPTSLECHLGRWVFQRNIFWDIGLFTEWRCVVVCVSVWYLLSLSPRTIGRSGCNNGNSQVLESKWRRRFATVSLLFLVSTF